MTEAKEHWAAFLNPDLVRMKLISAGLFLAAHEMLRQTIKDHPLEFFSDKWTQAGPAPSPRYAAEVLALDPKGKNDPIRGSLAWWKKMKAIDDKDMAAIKRVDDARNQIAHEMSMLVSRATSPDYLEHFATLVSLIRKIETWWIVNVELPTNPDYDDKEIQEDGITPGPIWVLQVLSQVALGDGDDAWEFHRHLFGEESGKATDADAAGAESS